MFHDHFRCHVHLRGEGLRLLLPFHSFDFLDLKLFAGGRAATIGYVSDVYSSNHRIPAVVDSGSTCGLNEVLVVKFNPPGGRVIPGDCNLDGRLNIADATCILGVLFLGGPAKFPCGDGTPTHAANVTLLDWEPVDRTVNISDALGTLNFLFLGGPRHVLAVPGAEFNACVPIVGCRAACLQ